MSKLIDKLLQSTETASQPLGFRVFRPSSARPKMALIAVAGQMDDMGQLADYLSYADAIIAESSAQKDIAKSLPSAVLGVWPKKKGQQPETGADFAVLPLDMEFGLSSTEKVGKILLVEPSLSDGLLRTINELPADAVLLAGNETGDSLTWRQLMLCQRSADLLSKPLLLMTPAPVSGEELEALWKTGVDGVVITVKTTTQAERLKELRQIIDKTDFTTRPRKKVAALLPRLAEEAKTTADDAEEEEEE